MSAKARTSHDDDIDTYVSRTQRKRASTALQVLGIELSTLSPAHLERLPLSEDLKEAIRVWHNTSTHEGKRRQMQFVGKVMREIEDITLLEEAIIGLRENHNASSKLFKNMESLRDTIIATPLADRQDLLKKELASCEDSYKDLLELAKKADNEIANGRPPHAKRALFRLLKTLSAKAKQ